MNYQQMLEYIYELRRFGIKPGLEPIKNALRAFGNPEKDLKFIHITGTNGKGSVAAMVNSILQKAGYRVGMFTSPHLVDFRERIRVNNMFIEKDVLLDICNSIFEKDLKLTFFEFITLVALLYFKQENVDYVMLEVGLGGKLDATNAVDAFISAITSIALDHTEILGNDVETIAKDKCGIIKKGSTVVTTSNNWQVLPVIKKKVEEMDSELIIAKPTEYPLRLRGDFQKENAGIAVEIARLIGVSDSVIREGLFHAEWPGRVEYVEKNIIVDGAHNVAAMSELSKYISGLSYRKLILVMGVTQNRDYRAMLEVLPKVDKLIFTQAKVSRSLNLDLVEIDCEKIKEPSEALAKAKSIATEQDLILVTGSLYLVGNIKEIYEHQENLIRVAM